MNHLAVECPGCREWMSLSQFDLTWTAREGLTVAGEIECPNPDCELVFAVERGEAVYEAKG
ncbi:MAG TPA: hypothetical protein VF654_05480 [Pyrinomonadaceae bacterium]|jgi:hypothetical protein